MAEVNIPAGVEKGDGDFLTVTILLSFCYPYRISKKAELVKCIYGCALPALSSTSPQMIICKK